MIGVGVSRSRGATSTSGVACIQGSFGGTVRGVGEWGSVWCGSGIGRPWAGTH